VMRTFDIAPLPAALIASIAMATSPAVVLSVTREQRGQGQVTERTLLFTALNSIYAVVLSTLLLGWARVEDRGVVDDFLLHPAYLIVGSVALAALGARLFLLVLGFVGRERAAQILVMLAVVWLVFALSLALRLSPLLTLLACGAFVRTFDTQRVLMASEFGLASGIALVLFFALSAATFDTTSVAVAWLPAAALIVARVLVKLGAMAAFAPLTGIAFRKGLLTGLGLLPMSALALMLIHQTAELSPQIRDQTGGVLVVAVALLQLGGALTLVLALRLAGEARTDR
jgi:NhaP-type Na+/H+ or K+/H+ antiporter